MLELRAYQQVTLQKHIAAIRGRHQKEKSIKIQADAWSFLHEIVVAKKVGSVTDTFWDQIGNPAVAESYLSEVVLAKFREALDSPLFLYVEDGSGTDTLTVYSSSKTAPSSPARSASASKVGYVGEAAIKMIFDRHSKIKTA